MLGMVQRGEGLRFVPEPGGALGIRGEHLGQDLDRDVAIQAGVAGAIHLAHAPLTQLPDDGVHAEAHVDVQRHGCSLCTTGSAVPT